MDPALLPEDARAAVERIGTADIVVGLATAGPAPALATVAAAVRTGLDTHFPGQSAAIAHVDQARSFGHEPPRVGRGGFAERLKEVEGSADDDDHGDQQRGAEHLLHLSLRGFAAFEPGASKRILGARGRRKWKKYRLVTRRCRRPAASRRST